MSDWDDFDAGGNDGSRRRWGRIAGGVVALLVLLVGGLVIARAVRSGSSTEDGATATSSPTQTPAPGSRSVVSTTTTTASPSTTLGSATSTTAATTSQAPRGASVTAVDDTSATIAVAAPTSSTRPPTDGTAAGATTSTPGSIPSYATLPDGTPAPIVAVFEVNQITLTGAVPSQDAKDRLQALAIANSKTPAAVANFLTIDPSVPASIGVRVVELTSARFPEGSAEVQGAHAKELDRAASIMTALPKVTALVIGHADQVGDAQSNYILSAERAKAVVDYLASVDGIDPARLSSRAVGESDLLTLNDDAAALALNRRTEFVFYGLLAT